MTDATSEGDTRGPTSTRFSRRGLLAGGLGVAGLAIGSGGSAAAFELTRHHAAADVPAPANPRRCGRFDPAPTCRRHGCR